METYVRLLRPCGTIVLEDPDWGSWHFNPRAEGCQKLIALIQEAFARWGDADAGRNHLELLRSFGIEGNVRAEVLASRRDIFTCGCPCSSASVWNRDCCRSSACRSCAGSARDAENELQEPARWGTTSTLMQSWGRIQLTGGIAELRQSRGLRRV
jgi:hypothetical protein